MFHKLKALFAHPRNTILALVLLLPLLAAGQTRSLLPVPNVAGWKTLKCDFHMHTVFSDGQVWPATRVAEAWRIGLDAIAITDHNHYNPHQQDVMPDLARPYALARADAERLGIVLVPGVEVAEGDYHANALFVTDPNAFKKLTLREALQTARAQDAFVFWNHPGWKTTPSWSEPFASLHAEKLLQGVELVNGNKFYPEAFPWIEQKGLTILANTDLHTPAESGEQIRPITLVFARTVDVAGIREALFARRTAAWLGKDVWGGEPLLRGLWEGAVTLENPELRPGRTVLRLRNNSALTFRIRPLKTPEWLNASALEISPESVSALPLRLAKNAPAGNQNVELEFEISNLHVAPGQDLRVRLPLRFTGSR